MKTICNIYNKLYSLLHFILFILNSRINFVYFLYMGSISVVIDFIYRKYEQIEYLSIIKHNTDCTYYQI